MKIESEGFADVNAAREFAGDVGVSTVYHWVSKGKFPKPFKLGCGGRVGWRWDELRAWRDSMQRAEIREVA
jgi:predicted DNA-binding transcriptional regulator AlpA